MKHELPRLPYAYDALEPYIDARTMEIHYGKHHATYVDKLNKALEAYPDFQGKSVEELLKSLNSLPSDIQKPVRNHGGGHYNHSMFWTIMRKDGEGKPQGGLLQAIEKRFKTFEDFKKEFSTAAGNHFGSGWAWLISRSNSLEIITTPNQDNPLMEGIVPIMGLDVWEHAYYLKYQNRRPEYIEAWWQVVNWTEVARRFDKI
jgi:Fe-Mn family superoxide dismutase